MNSSCLVVGGMAGSSMDGLDLVLVEFFTEGQPWTFRWHKHRTFPYPQQLYDQLQNSTNARQKDQRQLDVEFGEWIGQTTKKFIQNHAVTLAAIHGHTVIHQPIEGISWQLGCGQSIANLLNVPVITQFRTKDIELGGQGAPLVPFGDFTLFSSFDACLNLGGICNVSIREKQLAWDIAPSNQVLNYFSNKLGSDYDNEGAMARSGTTDLSFLTTLRGLSYFHEPPPKSLDNQYISQKVLDLINPTAGLRTYVEFLSSLISSEIRAHPEISNLLVTGGGAYNRFLIEQLSEKLQQVECVIPDEPLISFKEALIFAFLGLRRLRNEKNVLASVTGAKADSCSGVIHFAN